MTAGAERGLGDGADAPRPISCPRRRCHFGSSGVVSRRPIRISERRRDAVAANIRVGVRIEQGDTGADQKSCRLRVGHGQEGCAAQEGVMRDDHVERLPVTGGTGDSLVCDGRGDRGQEDRHARARQGLQR